MIRTEKFFTKITSFTHSEIKRCIKVASGVLAIVLLFGLASDVAKSQKPAMVDFPTIIDGYNVPESTYDPAIGVLVLSLKNPSAWAAGIDMIDSNHGLTAGHALDGLLDHQDMYAIFGCRDLNDYPNRCPNRIERQVKYATVLQKGVNWNDPVNDDVGVVFWTDIITGIESVTLDSSHMTIGPDVQVVRGNGCTQVDGTNYPVQKEALIEKNPPPSVPNEEYYKAYAGGDGGGAVCSGDSGGFIGYFTSSLNKDAKLATRQLTIQTGVSVRGNDGKSSVGEKVRAFSGWIGQCMLNVCEGIKIYPPSEATATPSETPVPVGTSTPTSLPTATLYSTPTWTPPAGASATPNPQNTEEILNTPTWTPGPPVTVTPAGFPTLPICPTAVPTPLGFELTPTATPAQNISYLALVANGKCFYTGG